MKLQSSEEKETPRQIFFCEFFLFFKITYFQEHLQKGYSDFQEHLQKGYSEKAVLQKVRSKSFLVLPVYRFFVICSRNIFM